MKLKSRLTDAIHLRRDNKPWARRLDAVLKKRGITDTELADIIGKSPRVARSLRTGRRTIPIGVIAEIARHLQVSVVVVLDELENADIDGDPIRRPTDYCAEPEIDGIGGGL